jgi:translation initiation factor IF-2
MAKTRVRDLAKELGVRHQRIRAILKEMEIIVHGPQSVVDEAAVDLVRDAIAKERAARRQARAVRDVRLPQVISVADLSECLQVSSAQVQKALMTMGVFANVNQSVEYETAARVAERFGIACTHEDIEEAAVKARRGTADMAGAIARPPVVAVLGHVDHGKTTLLDKIRKAHVTDSEFGGITQHIGAYQVRHKYKRITFLDTPGHEAFTTLRARGAMVTDIAVLVVAADDGVMPQTVEAINHAKAANVPILVAVNKIDLPNANPERVKQQLTDHGLLWENWGGNTVMVDVSAKTGDGITEMLEMILLLAEVGEYKANPKALGQGVVIEARLERGRGPVATVLIQNGSLSVGNAILAGATHGRIKAMTDHAGKRIAKAGPSTPVEIVGLDEVPEAGDRVEEVSDDREARQMALARSGEARQRRLATASYASLEGFSREVAEGRMQELNVVLKCDVHGSAEAVKQALDRLATGDIRVKVVHVGVGTVTESDVMLASASNGVVVGFNVNLEPNAKAAAEHEGVDIRSYHVIYDLTQDIKLAMVGMLEPEYAEKLVGTAEVRRVFHLPNDTTVAGCYVTDGKVQRNSVIKVRRGDEIVFTGKLTSLRHLKDDVREMAAGYECGIAAEGFNEYEEGDIIECFIVEEVERTV